MEEHLNKSGVCACLCGVGIVSKSMECNRRSSKNKHSVNIIKVVQ